MNDEKKTLIEISKVCADSILTHLQINDIDENVAIHITPKGVSVIRFCKSNKDFGKTPTEDWKEL